MKGPHPELEPGLTDLPDDAPDTARGGPALRQCCVTRERLTVRRLIRFALAPSGEVTPDISQRLPGRGVWVKADRATLEKAAEKGHFARAFKTKVTVPDDLVARVEALTEARCLSLIGFARKSGHALCGETQVREALERRAPSFLLEASDGAEDGHRRMVGLARARYGDVVVLMGFDAAKLGSAFGRDRVIHALLRKGPMADAVKAVYERLECLRPPPKEA